MLKIVPDPPMHAKDSRHSFEALLIPIPELVAALIPESAR
ncbi:hypothetical protein CCOS865_04074 [Pseudomonas reidholzensis]|uniref:Uncharacterized protein n=1 Tax=Pseudomonas reidholzensis TaxID=1785162 RepID=A0A383RYS9_9PSED|nr:hypothetical protein CCOS865_04074 [Pseudomonas reidholzensis]